MRFVFSTIFPHWVCGKPGGQTKNLWESRKKQVGNIHWKSGNLDFSSYIFFRWVFIRWWMGIYLPPPTKVRTMHLAVPPFTGPRRKKKRVGGFSPTHLKIYIVVKLDHETPRIGGEVSSIEVSPDILILVQISLPCGSSSLQSSTG